MFGSSFIARGTRINCVLVMTTYAKTLPLVRTQRINSGMRRPPLILSRSFSLYISFSPKFIQTLSLYYILLYYYIIENSRIELFNVIFRLISSLFSI